MEKFQHCQFFVLQEIVIRELKRTCDIVDIEALNRL